MIENMAKSVASALEDEANEEATFYASDAMENSPESLHRCTVPCQARRADSYPLPFRLIRNEMVMEHYVYSDN